MEELGAISFLAPNGPGERRVELTAERSDSPENLHLLIVVSEA